MPVYTPANEGKKSDDGNGGQGRPDFRKITHGGSDKPGAEGEDKGAFQQPGQKSSWFQASHLLPESLGAVVWHGIALYLDITVNLIPPDIPAGLVSAGE